LPEDQLLFAFEEIEATLAEGAAEAARHAPKLHEQQPQRRRANRGHLPAHLPRVEQVLRPARDTASMRRPAVSSTKIVPTLLLAPLAGSDSDCALRLGSSTRLPFALFEGPLAGAGA
jgi:hypothetical protein